MRVVGAVAVFVLFLVAIIQGAFFVKLSREVKALSAEVRAANEVRDSDDFLFDSPTGRQGAGSRRAPRPVTLAPGAALPSAPARVLREALDTPEGREHLQETLNSLKDEQRRAEVSTRATFEKTRQQAQRNRLLRLAALSADERSRVDDLYRAAEARRERLLEELRAGGDRTVEEIADDLEQLSREPLDGVTELLGEERMKRFREAHLADLRARANTGR
jgi:hypothetical protein